MKNNLLVSALIVFLFWYAILLIVGLPPLDVVPDVVLGTLTIWAVSWPVGALLSLTWRRITLRSARLLPAERSGVIKATIMANPETLELVDVPIPQAAPVARGKDADKLLRACSWWAEYSKRHPEYARAMLAVVEVMQSKPGLPAAPEPRGHGGATLWEHSLHVLDACLELAPKWKYTGMRNSKGAIVVPVQDLQRGYHAFDEAAMEHPLLYLACIAHDIGKVECYDWAPGRRVKEVKDDHGTVGAAMLRRMPEIMALPIKERDALILAVSYYHHASNMPTSHWIGDLPRSLTGLLYEADCLASVREGDANEEKVAAVKKMRAGQSVHVGSTDGDDQDSAQQVPANEAMLSDLTGNDGSKTIADEAAELAGESMESAPQDERVVVDQPAQPSHTAVAKTVVVAPSPQPKGNDDTGPHWASDDGRTPLDVLLELLATPDFVNGKNSRDRMAIKFSPWVYVFEAKMRQHAAKVLQDPSLVNLPSKANLHPFTKELLRQLDAQDLLMREFNGRTYSYKRHLWKAFAGKGDDEHGTERHMLVIKDSILPRHMEDAKYPPKILGNFWGDMAAINKKGLSGAEGVATPTAESEESAADQEPRESLEADHTSATSPDVPLNPQDAGGADTAAASLPPLTAQALRELAHDPMMSARILEKDGRPVAFVPFAGVSAMYSFDPQNLPDGVTFVYGKDRTVGYLRVEL